MDKDIKKEVELAPIISHQNKYKAKDLDANVNADKAEAKDNNFAWVES